jgi:hypothetical protein
VAASVAHVRAPSSDHSLTLALPVPDQPLDLTHSVPLYHQGIPQLTEAARLLSILCCSPLKKVPQMFYIQDYTQVNAQVTPYR